MLIEWDENKRQSNVRKHGFDLMRGAELFDGRPVVTYPSPRGGESRFVTIGLLVDQFVAVVWTQREDAVSTDLAEKGKKCREKSVS